MPYNTSLIQGCEEYKIGYAVAYPLLHKAARAMVETTAAHNAAEALEKDSSLRQTVIAAMEAASPANLGARGRHVQSIAYEHALAYAAVRAHSQTDFAGLSAGGVIG